MTTVNLTDLISENDFKGYTGSQGNIGYTGSAGAGYTGSQGDFGYTGSEGIQGNIGYTGSQGDVGYTGSAGADGLQGNIGYTGSEGLQGAIGYTGSAGADGTIGVDGYTGSQGAVGYTGSAGTGGGGSGLQTKTMDYTGTLVTFTGTKRWWINGDYTISNLYAFVSTPAVGANIDLSVNKNGTLAETINIEANVNSSVKAANVSLALGDYITVDVTQVGSTTAGADLSLIFEYS